ncbi:MAG: MMPL family transporter, partial [Candidatus Omnitrophica bacterium]|nr:MMPL family transporter [Candidatus Omnitrophota bacterium]
MFRRFAEIVLVLRWPLFLVLLLATLIHGFAVFKLQIDPSIDSLFDKKSPEYAYYRAFVRQYGSDQIIAIAMSTNDLFTMDNLETLKFLTDQVSRLSEVERVISLTNAMDIRHKFLGIKIVPAIQGVLEREKSVHEFKKEVLSNEMFLNNLVSKDGENANIVVYLKSEPGHRTSRGDVIKEIENLLSRLERPGLKFYVAGSPVEQHEFVRLLRRDQYICVPVIFAFLVLTNFLFYRNLSCMILPITIVIMALVWMMATIVYLGQELNLVTSLLTPVVMIIAIKTSVLYMNLFFEMRPHHSSLRETILLTMGELGMPSLLTHFTTILGFASLAFNPVPAIQSFGIFAAVGAFYSFLILLLVTPILLPVLPYRQRKDSLDDRHIVNWFLGQFLEKFEFRWKWVIMVIAGLTFVAALFGISKIKVDTNIVKQMKPDSKLAIATRFIDEHLTGVYVMGFVINRKDGQLMTDTKTLCAIDRFKAYLESKPEITNVNSITTLIKKIHHAREEEADSYQIPEDQETLDRYFEGIQRSRDPNIRSFISSDLKEIRLEARMKAVGTSEGAAVEADVRRYLDQKLGKEFDYHLAGNVVLLGRMATDLVRNQIDGFQFALLSIT